MKEYAIWGVPPGASEETLCLSHPGGKPITSKEDVEKWKKVLSEIHKVTKLRVQEIDFGKEFDFAKEAGL